MSKWVREGRRAAADDGGTVAAAARLAIPLGQGEALADWVRRARRRLLPHAVVVEGQGGSGKTTVLQWLSAALLCPSDLDADMPCGVCRTCSRIAGDRHPDVHVVARARDEADRKEHKRSFYVIGIDQVRQAQERLAQSAVEGPARVLVVSDADCMTEEAQNALLKTLEEPGQDAFLLLEAARPELLLPTVRSRVQRLRLLPLADQVLRGELAKRIPQRERWFDAALAVAHGCLGAALRASTEQAVQLHDLVRQVLDGSNRLGPLATARAVLAGHAERHLQVEAAETFLWLLRGELRAQCSALAASATPAYPAAVAEPWTTWLELTLAAERDLEILIPPEQALTALLVSFAGR